MCAGGGRDYSLYFLFIFFIPVHLKLLLKNKVYLEFLKSELILRNIFSIEYSRWYKNMAKIMWEVCGWLTFGKHDVKNVYDNWGLC